MQEQDVAGKLKIQIPRRKEPAPQATWLDISYSEVDISPPTTSDYKNSITLWAVYVREHNTTSDYEPIEWMLLTTFPVKCFQVAQKIVEWYSGRWGIEVYHKTLKSGCKIEERQLGKAKRLKACLGVDMVVAWRIYYLTMLGREVPQSPCTAFFDDVEWKALCCYINRKPIPPKEPPTLSKAINMVGRLGGYLGRESDSPPGIKVLWRGLQKLDIVTETYKIFKDKSPP